MFIRLDVGSLVHIVQTRSNFQMAKVLSAFVKWVKVMLIAYGGIQLLLNVLSVSHIFTSSYSEIDFKQPRELKLPPASDIHEVETASAKKVTPTVSLCPHMKNTRVDDLAPPFSETKLSAIRPTNASSRNVTFVIADSYYRSGSSVFGRTLKHHPDVFYLFEPFRLPFQYYMNRKHLKNNVTDLFIDPSTGEYRALELNFTRWIVKQAENIFQCKLIEARTAGMPFREEWMTKCLAAEKKLVNRLHKNQLEHSCLRHLQNQCLHANMRIFKTIRLPMEVIHEIMLMVPQIKILYLTRDPRAIYNSRKQIDPKRYSFHAKERIVELCHHIDHDLKLYNNGDLHLRSLHITYDEIIKYPVETITWVYKWLGLKSCRKLVSAVIDLATSKKEGDLPSRIPKWVQNFNQTENDLILEECKYVIESLGYSESNGL